MGLIIGLSGKSCSGKNFVGNYLAEKGFEVWDLDRKAAEIRVDKKDEIIKTFGTDDSRIIRDIVFSDPEKRKALENIIYPEMERRILSCNHDLIINGATIRRAGMDRLCNFLIYVDAPYSVRLKRALKRDGITGEIFMARDASQKDISPDECPYRCPVYTVDNTEGPDYKKIDEIIAEGLDKYGGSRQES